METKTLERYQYSRSYSTSKDSLLNDFYIPSLERSIRYDRAAGFFSSALIALAPIAFSDFIKRSGRIRLICSPNFSSSDISALKNISNFDEISRDQVIGDLKKLAEGEEESRILSTLLGSLVAANILELRIAIPVSSRGLFHDKVGIFSDADRVVSFVGSANETMAAWSGFDNHEQIEVFTSWLNQDSFTRTQEHQKLFNELWAGLRRGWKVMNPQDGIDLINRVIKPTDVEVAMDRVRSFLSKERGANKKNSSRPLMSHQLEVLEDWENHNRRGIISFATGGGKTLAAIEAVKRWTSDGKPALILVPSQILHKQWTTEIQLELPNSQVVPVGAGFSLSGRESILRSAFEEQKDGPGKIILSTYSSASKNGFLDLIRNPEKTLICADEVHNIGANESQNIMRTVNFRARLGLSATPSRHHSEDETQQIQDYFGSILSPLFTLKDAIAAKRLVPYNYYFETVKLLPEEEAYWDDLTSKIGRIVASNKGKMPTEASERSYFTNLLIKRSAILKSADAKVEVARKTVEEQFMSGDRWLIYCQDQVQMNEVKKSLSRANFPILDYHQAMSGDPNRTLEFFTREGGVMLAIKCLDEGVDIPEINRALILASSTNPREYIQRRGRVLRAKEGKFSADIYDVLVLDTANRLLSPGEAIRALEFAEDAQNSATKLKLKILLDNSNTVDYVFPSNVNEQDG